MGDDFLRFLTILFLNIRKWNNQKIVSGFFKIFFSILFLIFEKTDQQKICPGFLRFVSILF